MSRFCGVSCQNSTGFVSLSDNYYQCVPNECIVQSDVDTTVEKQVTTEFADGNIGVTSGEEVSKLWYQPTNTADSDLADFLSRPVNIFTTTNAVGTGLVTNFNPWSLYLGSENIKYKLHNYAFIRCDLKLKVMINASPFYYGAYLLNYRPLETVFDSAPLNGAGDPNIGRSQRPHAFFYPQDDAGCELTLPYLNTTEWLPIHGTQGTLDIARMGVASIKSYITLKNVGISSSDVSINVYCWAENVQLSGLTVDLAVQTDRDEYTGPVSKIASAAARATGILSHVPIIGNYMTATSMASQMVADTAASFGYTKVPVLERILPFKDLPFHGLATSDQPDVTEKLTLDSKNELTINNTAIGDPNADALLISKFCMRNSYLTNFAWSATDSANALLWNSYVSPVMHKYTVGASQGLLDATPMFLPTRMFQYWRGDIIFDFKIICSQYHKGRIRFSWDPVGDVANVPSNTQTVFNHIQDISQSTTVSLRVPYIQRTSYLKVPEDVTATYYSTLALPPDSSDTVNGILTVRVLNEQTSPVSSADIDIMVFVRAAENIEFAAPKQLDSNLNFYTVQGDFDKVEEVVMGAPSNVDPNVNLVYMGESIVSFRELMQRANHHVTWRNSIFHNASLADVMYINRRPIYRGFDPNGVHSATGPISTVSEPFNFVTNTPYHLLTSCFLGERGSITWKINSDTHQYQTIKVGRSRHLLTANDYNPNTNGYSISGTSTDELASLASSFDTSNAGINMTNQKTNAGCSVNIPMYSIYTMLDTNPGDRTLGLTNVATTTDSVQVSWVVFEDRPSGTEQTQFPVELMFQVGPDHSLVFFLNVPTLYVYDSPVPV